MGKNGDDSALIQNLVGRLKPGSFLCHLSTVSPQFASRATALCGRHSVVYGNYPVTGGPVGAETGKLLILCSGSEELFQRLSAPLRYLGEPRFFGLRSDAAAEVKLIGHVMVFCGLLGISGAAALQSECFLGGTVGGGEQSEFLEFLNRGAGGTRQWEVALSKGLRDGVWDQGFFIEHALVDALYLAELLRERGVSSIIIHPIIDLALAFSFVLRTTTGGLATHSVVRELIKSRAAELDRFIDERRGGVAERIIHVVESLPPALRSTVQFDALASA
jgi:3-hydroxyisobutyrate dehydrogenase